MERLRAFVALNLPINVTNQLAGLQRELATAAETHGSRVSWVPAANLHVTLKFLGEIPGEGAYAMRDRLQSRLKEYKTWSLTVRGVGVFPDASCPRVVWAGIEDTGQTAALAGDINGWLDDLGFAPDTRVFHPHVTLGRIREGAASFWEQAAEREVGVCSPTEVVLYESKLQRQGAEYVVLGRSTLVSAPNADRSARFADADGRAALDAQGQTRESEQQLESLEEETKSDG